MNSLVSIIVPVYKLEAWLPTCVKSLRAQSHAQIEILLVDDGSPDLCPKICDAYAQLDARVKVIHTPNRGVSAARNTGLEQAHGEFVLFVDGDDWIAPNMVERMLECLVHNRADICVCNLTHVYSEQDEPEFVQPGNSICYGAREFLEHIMTDAHCLGYPCNKLFRRQLIGSNRFQENLHVCEDLAFCARLAEANPAVVQIEDALYYYRQRTTKSISYSDKIFSVIRAYESLMPLYGREAPHLIPLINMRYLKLNLNMKGRMGISHIHDKERQETVDTNIASMLRPVLLSRHVSLASKINIFLTWLMPKAMLRLKRAIS